MKHAKTRLTYIEILLKGSYTIPHFVVIKIGLNKGDLNVCFAGVQLVLFNNVRVSDDDNIFLEIEIVT